MPGYHKKEIEKGTLGEVTKICEEFDEFLDAHEQTNPVMELLELTDLIGAIEAYTQKYYNIKLEQLITMTKATQRAFTSGQRK